VFDEREDLLTGADAKLLACPIETRSHEPAAVIDRPPVLREKAGDVHRLAKQDVQRHVDPENDPAKCALHYACRQRYCTAKDGVCLRVSAADCERSDDCREQGECGWAQGRGVATEAGRRASEPCKALGRCELGDGYCTARKN